MCVRERERIAFALRFADNIGQNFVGEFNIEQPCVLLKERERERDRERERRGERQQEKAAEREKRKRKKEREKEKEGSQQV